MELRNTLKNMFLNGIRQDLILLTEKIKDIDMEFLGLVKNQQQDLWEIYWDCLKNIEKIETLTLVEIADCYKRDGWNITSKEF